MVIYLVAVWVPIYGLWRFEKLKNRLRLDWDTQHRSKISQGASISRAVLAWGGVIAIQLWTMFWVIVLHPTGHGKFDDNQPPFILVLPVIIVFAVLAFGHLSLMFAKIGRKYQHRWLFCSLMQFIYLVATVVPIYGIWHFWKVYSNKST